MNHLKTLALCVISLILCCQVASATTITLNNNLSNDKINTSNLGQIKNQTNLQLINNQIHPQKTIHKKNRKNCTIKKYFRQKFNHKYPKKSQTINKKNKDNYLQKK